MRIDDGEGDQEATVELTPLIDVVFQLLIFFMVTMSFVKNREYLLPVDLTETAMAEQPPDEEFEGMTITVLADDKVVVDGDEVVDDATVQKRLEKLHARNPAAHIMMRGDEAATHGRVLRLLDLVKSMGFHKVDMIVTTTD